MADYAILIQHKYALCLEDIEKNFKNSFPSEDYMRGFLDGYLFDSYEILTIEEYEKRVYNHNSTLQDKWLKFVSIERDYGDDYE